MKPFKNLVGVLTLLYSGIFLSLLLLAFCGGIGALIGAAFGNRTLGAELGMIPGGICFVVTVLAVLTAPKE